jgi:UDPglucose--hexose-1-phosphate uridylyltransferase
MPVTLPRSSSPRRKIVHAARRALLYGSVQYVAGHAPVPKLYIGSVTTISFASSPHRRYNPLLDEWVLCSPQRLARPWQGLVDTSASASMPPHDDTCYLCPGNARASDKRNPNYHGTFAFDNDFPALRPDVDAALSDERGLLVAHAVSGVCRVLCYSPRHDLTLARMSLREIASVVDAWCLETAALREREGVSYVQLFENSGPAMGASNPHPHCQLWGVGVLPTRPARMLTSMRAYWTRHHRDLLGDYLALEMERGERVVCENAYWVALVPFWAVWPYQLMLLPRRAVSHLASLAPDERAALADLVQRVHVRLDNLFSSPMPYSMAWFEAPGDGTALPPWRLHAEYFPPLLRSATVRKFFVGYELAAEPHYELAAEPQRDLTAEDAAARLREQAEVHHASTR